MQIVRDVTAHVKTLMDRNLMAMADRVKKLALRHITPAVMRRAYEILTKSFQYLMLISLSFVFIYPMLYIISSSFMQADDITDATVQWIPKELSFKHYIFAYTHMNFWPTFINSFISSIGSAVAQIISCAVIGYGFARYRFPGYHLLLGLILFTFLTPPQTIVVPLFMLFGEIEWLNTFYPFIVPSAFGHGLRGALFVIIFIQFFRGLPKQLEEAARIDGAGHYRIFWSVMYPLAKPAILVVFLFSIVWHWNDVFEPGLYLLSQEYYHLPQMISIMTSNDAQKLLQAQMLTGGTRIGSIPTNYNRVMAGSLLTILPLMILYAFTQRHFVESVERTGISGE